MDKYSYLIQWFHRFLQTADIISFLETTTDYMERKVYLFALESPPRTYAQCDHKRTPLENFSSIYLWTHEICRDDISHLLFSWQMMRRNQDDHQNYEKSDHIKSKNTTTPKSTTNLQQLHSASNNVTDPESEAIRYGNDEKASVVLFWDHDSDDCCSSHAVFLDIVTRMSAWTSYNRTRELEEEIKDLMICWQQLS